MGNIPLHKKIIRKISHEWLCGFGVNVWKVVLNSTQLFLFYDDKNAGPLFKAELNFESADLSVINY